MIKKEGMLRSTPLKQRTERNEARNGEREKLVRSGLATGNNRLRGFESSPTASRNLSPSLPSAATKMERLREKVAKAADRLLSLEGQVFTGMILRGATTRAYTGRWSEAILLIKRWGIDPNKLAIKPDESPRDRASTTFPPMFLSVSFLFARSVCVRVPRPPCFDDLPSFSLPHRAG